MKAEYLNPFVDSVSELFNTMLSCKATRQNISASKGGQFSGALTSMIGLGGHVKGAVALSFPEETALALAGNLLCMEVSEMNQEVSDAMAEMVNIVAGSAKTKFKDADKNPVDISLPTVVYGNNFTIGCPSQAMWLEVSFKSDLGPFTLRVTIE